MKALVWALVACGIVVAFSLWTFWMAVRPPRMTIPGTPAEHRLAAEEVRIATDDGVALAGWLVPAPGGRPPAATPVIVLLHGYPANKADLLPIAASLNGRFAVLLVDFRYFGDSGGRATTLGFRERRDLQRVVDALAQRGYRRIGVFGYSLGGAVALLAAAEDPRIHAVAAWAPFADLRVLAGEVYGAVWLLKYPLVELMILWGRLFFGADITRPSPELAATRLRIPVQVWASRDDDQIPFGHAERVRRALAGNPRAEFQFGRGLHNERVESFDRLLAEFFARSL